MNVVDKRNLLNFVFFPIGSFLLALLGIIHPVLSFLAFIYAYIIIIHLALNIKCPNCGENIGMQRHRWKSGKVRITYSPTLYTPRKCVYCNHILKE